MKVTANPAIAVDGGIPSVFHSARLWSAATDLRRSAVEVSIEKYEKTAMQWPQEQTLVLSSALKPLTQWPKPHKLRRAIKRLM